MTIRNVLMLAAALVTVTNCTPYQEIDRGDTPPVAADPMPVEPPAEVSTGSNDGGAMEVDRSVAVVYEIRNRADIPTFVTSQMTLADKDANGQLTADEYDLLAPALAQADNSLNPSAEGGPVANPGAEEVVDGSGGDAIRRDTFFTMVAGPDGLITASELESALTTRFEDADANNDGALDAAESKTFAASMLSNGN